MAQCFVKSCGNTIRTDPHKFYFPVPNRPFAEREKWFTSVGLNVDDWTTHRFKTGVSVVAYCCQDHFKFPDDIRNMRELMRTNGGIVPTSMLKQGRYPRLFVGKNLEIGHTVMLNPTPNGEPIVTTSVIAEDQDPLSVIYVDDSSSGSSCVLSEMQELPCVTSRTVETEKSVSESPAIPKLRIRNPIEINNPSMPLVGLDDDITPSSSIPVSSLPSFSSPIRHPLSTPSSSTIQPTIKNNTLYSLLTSNPAKRCLLQSCSNDSNNRPESYFVQLPLTRAAQEACLDAFNLPRSVLPEQCTTPLYCCKDHLEPVFHQSAAVEPTAESVPQMLLMIPVKASSATTKGPQVTSTMSTPLINQAEPVRSTEEDEVPENPQADSPTRNNETSVLKVKSVTSSRVPGTDKGAWNKNIERFAAKFMPSLPICDHNTEDLKCSNLTRRDVIKFFNDFHLLRTTEEQDAFFFKHMDREAEGGHFLFSMWRTSSKNEISVCFGTFSRALAIDENQQLQLISIATRYFDKRDAGRKALIEVLESPNSDSFCKKELSAPNSEGAEGDQEAPPEIGVTETCRSEAVSGTFSPNSKKGRTRSEVLDERSGRLKPALAVSQNRSDSNEYESSKNHPVPRVTPVDSSAIEIPQSEIRRMEAKINQKASSVPTKPKKSSSGPSKRQPTSVCAESQTDWENSPSPDSPRFARKSTATLRKGSPSLTPGRLKQSNSRNAAPADKLSGGEAEDDVSVRLRESIASVMRKIGLSPNKLEKKREKKAYYWSYHLCSICLAVFKHESKYNAHREKSCQPTNLGKKNYPYACPVCSKKTVVSAKDLKRHFEKSHKYECKFCKVNYLERAGIETHLRESKCKRRVLQEERMSEAISPPSVSVKPCTIRLSRIPSSDEMNEKSKRSMSELPRRPATPETRGSAEPSGRAIVRVSETNRRSRRRKISSSEESTTPTKQLKSSIAIENKTEPDHSAAAGSSKERLSSEKIERKAEMNESEGEGINSVLMRCECDSFFVCQICGAPFSKQTGIVMHYRRFPQCASLMSGKIPKPMSKEAAMKKRKKLVAKRNKEMKSDEQKSALKAVKVNRDFKFLDEDPEEKVDDFYKCKACGEVFANKGLVREHYDRKEECHPEMRNTYPCPSCSAKIKGQLSFIRHFAEHGTPGRLTKPGVGSASRIRCFACNLFFAKADDMIRHSRLVHAEQYFCSKCDHEAESFASFYRHIFAKHEMLQIM